MDKLEYLRNCKSYLRKVRDYRRTLLRMHAGKPENINMVKTIAELDYRIPSFITFESMYHYIMRPGVQANIRELIPTNKPAWNEELDELIKHAFLLKFGKIPELV